MSVERRLDVLVACEYSGVVRDAFIRKGHNAVSCDLLPTDFFGPHIQGDVLQVLDRRWDLIIGHPPCQYLCRQASRWIDTPVKRILFKQACAFFLKLWNADCECVCLENPVPHLAAKKEIGDYSQIIQPWQFGHDYSKKTCLWLRGLDFLEPTEIVQLTYVTTKNGRRYTRGWYETPRNTKARSRTFPGIADAMADRWG
ncbi:MAG: DNA cytosine methyltransferase [Planctomycetes bacterium]|nr:DNA cytosine methyltransferase [Planctomycetota bacterium]